MKFFKGLHKDNHPSDQPPQTYRDARNVILKEERGAVTNEPGSVGTSLLPIGYTPIGKIFLPDERIVVFLAGQNGESEIGIIHTDSRYYTLVNDSRLAFDPDFPIQGVARISVARTLSQQYPDPEDVEVDETAIQTAEVVTVEVS